MHKEAAATIKINRLLENAGWCFFAMADAQQHTISIQSNPKSAAEPFLSQPRD